ncbi:MAG: ComF family protein [Prevotella sp.]|nr:ComF family protein [Candidatus Prevotella equi]
MENNRLAKRFFGRTGTIPFVRGASFIYHTPKSNTAKIVYDFKYYDNPLLARNIGEMMACEIGEDFFHDIDFIIPVPINYKKRWKRGYNQSEELSKGIAKGVKKICSKSIPIMNNAIKRSENNISQTRLSHLQRIDNIKDVFYLNEKAYKNKDIQNCHVLIVDDIITTGSTVIECIKQLQPIKGIKVSVLSLGCIR